MGGGAFISAWVGGCGAQDLLRSHARCQYYLPTEPPAMQSCSGRPLQEHTCPGQKEGPIALAVTFVLLSLQKVLPFPPPVAEAGVEDYVIISRQRLQVGVISGLVRV